MSLRPEDCIPGTLVECIDNSGWEGVPSPLVVGRLYTIRALVPACLPRAGLLIEGALHMTGTGTFGLYRFRRLPEERLSIFRQMLAPAPKQKERV